MAVDVQKEGVVASAEVGDLEMVGRVAHSRPGGDGAILLVNGVPAFSEIFRNAKK